MILIIIAITIINNSHSHHCHHLIQIRAKGNKTSIHIDNTEAKKITDHFDDVTARLQVFIIIIIFMIIIIISLGEECKSLRKYKK